MEKIQIGLVGLGRIGLVHLKSIVHHFPNIELHVVSNREMARQNVQKEFGIKNVYAQLESMLNVKEIMAVVIASATDTHVEYTRLALQAGKHVFCEKPLAQDLQTIRDIDHLAKERGLHLMIGFNQRFDRNWAGIKEKIDSGILGDLRLIKIVSRDPLGPPLEFARVSGGIFMDMMIHDFDMARFLSGKEVKEVYAQGKCWIDPRLAEFGDVDTALVTLTFEDGSWTSIDNCRATGYGYDQRIEVFGSKAMIKGLNQLENELITYDRDGSHTALPLDFFMNRYADSYYEQIKRFLEMVNGKSELVNTAQDTLQATAIALAAQKSIQEHRPVAVEEVI